MSFKMGLQDENQKKRVGRKLNKRQKLQRPSSMQYPDRLKIGEDVQEDVMATNKHIPQYMNHSIFSIIAAAGSKSEFHARFDDESSESDGEQEDASKGLDPKDAELTKMIEEPVNEIPGNPVKGRSSSRCHQKNLEHRFIKTLPNPNISTKTEKNYMLQSTILPPTRATSPPSNPQYVTPRDAPVMSRMLEAQAQLSSSVSGKDEGTASVSTIGQQKENQSPVTLATRLMEIFGLEKPEEVISGI